MKDWYRFFGSFIKDNTHLERRKEFPIKSSNDQMIKYIILLLVVKQNQR